MVDCDMVIIVIEFFVIVVCVIRIAHLGCRCNLYRQLAQRQRRAMVDATRSHFHLLCQNQIAEQNLERLEKEIVELTEKRKALLY